MSEAVLDLWPNEITAVEDAPFSPVAILRQQATAIAEKTNGAITGLVESFAETKPVPLENPPYPRDAVIAYFSRGHSQTVKTGGLVHALYLMTPTLEDYRYHLLSASHGGEAYPVRIRHAGKELECATAQEFMDALRTIFASDHTRRVIQTLLAQSIK
jgi:hypothetical protein